jgi:hypothetical protein
MEFTVRGGRRRAAWLYTSILSLLGVVGVTPDAHAQFVLGRRVDLKILVISAGDVGTAMVKAGLNEGLVPYTEVDLNAASRPVINDAFLADTVSLFIRRAKYQAVVLPNEAPSKLTTAELDALARFEREFKIRQFSSYVYPSPAVGLNYPANPGYLGPLDGLTANVTATAKAGAFSYLNGAVRFEDLDKNVSETYGYLATPLPADTVNKRSFTPFVTVTIPATTTAGVLLGVYTDNGREQLVMTSSVNQYQIQQQALFHGILNWLTYGVHLGTEKNFFSVHVDDVFLADARWSTASNCTVGDDCPASVTAPDILMTPADADYLVSWQTANGVKLDLAYNGSGYDEAIAETGSYPLGARLLALRSQFRWLNHTYTHMYLGCIQDFSVVPFRCATDARGTVLWATYQEIYDQIRNNQVFSNTRGLGIVAGELVTGEHSGLRRTPQEPSDNPNLARAFTNTGITWIGSDNSRETAQRVIGSARTSPRYPMNIFYNVGTKAEETDEYNWIYNSKANGGSGLCENNATSTCIAPLSLQTGFDSYIVPLEARTALLHVLSNSPRAHYAHQSNLAEDRILYPVLNKIIADYKAMYATNTPFVNARTADLGTEMKNQADWATNRSRVTGYIQNGKLTLTSSSTVNVPLTAPTGTTVGGAAALESYGGYRTGWRSIGGLFGTTFSLPSTVAYPR